jgi:hypothetical protein
MGLMLSHLISLVEAPSMGLSCNVVGCWNETCEVRRRLGRKERYKEQESDVKRRGKIVKEGWRDATEDGWALATYTTLLRKFSQSRRCWLGEGK